MLDALRPRRSHMKVALLVNGLQPTDRAHVLGVDDRGLQYGDGVFETALLTGGRIRFLEDHLARLEAGCQRLRHRLPGTRDVAQGPGVLIARPGRGRPQDHRHARHRAGGATVLRNRQSPPGSWRSIRLRMRHPADGQALAVRWCDTRLGRNPALAGIKHLNRLEQVLAQVGMERSCNRGRPDAGYRRRSRGCDTAGNLFIVREGMLCTPDLRYCGIRGVMRGRVLEAAKAIGSVRSRKCRCGAATSKRRAKCSSRMPSAESVRSTALEESHLARGRRDRSSLPPHSHSGEPPSWRPDTLCGLPCC